MSELTVEKLLEIKKELDAIRVPFTNVVNVIMIFGFLAKFLKMVI